MRSMDDKEIRKDILRYTKNKTSSSFALLAILFNVFYFVNIYKSDVADYYYVWFIGASIIYNLLFMMTIFLCSEGIKNYKVSYAYTMIIVGALQIARIFYIPRKAFAATVEIAGETKQVMEAAQHTRVVIYLLISAAFLIAGGIIGIMKSASLHAYEKSLAIKEAKA